jgi:hypothetical protein
MSKLTTNTGTEIYIATDRIAKNTNRKSIEDKKADLARITESNKNTRIKSRITDPDIISLILQSFFVLISYLISFPLTILFLQQILSLDLSL